MLLFLNKFHKFTFQIFRMIFCKILIQVQLPVFRAPRKGEARSAPVHGRGTLRTSLTTQKNCRGRGQTDRHTHRLCDFQTNSVQRAELVKYVSVLLAAHVKQRFIVSCMQDFYSSNCCMLWAPLSLGTESGLCQLLLCFRIVANQSIIQTCCMGHPINWARPQLSLVLLLWPDKYEHITFDIF